MLKQLSNCRSHFGDYNCIMCTVTGYLTGYLKGNKYGQTSWLRIVVGFMGTVNYFDTICNFHSSQ